MLVIVGFGLLSVACAGELVGGTLLARSVCAFIAFFRAARLGVQFFVFDANPHLKNAFLKHITFIGGGKADAPRSG